MSIIHLEMTEEEEKDLNKIALAHHKVLRQLDLSVGQHMGILIALTLRFIDASLKATEPGMFTVEIIVESLKESILRSWKATKEKRDQ
jgi:sorbitol-specific phosphotransferase system component IIBC